MEVYSLRKKTNGASSLKSELSSYSWFHFYQFTLQSECELSCVKHFVDKKSCFAKTVFPCFLLKWENIHANLDLQVLWIIMYPMLNILISQDLVRNEAQM